MIIPDHISEGLQTIFWVKNTKILLWESGSGIFLLIKFRAVIRDPGKTSRIRSTADPDPLRQKKVADPTGSGYRAVLENMSMEENAVNPDVVCWICLCIPYTPTIFHSAIYDKKNCSGSVYLRMTGTEVVGMTESSVMTAVTRAAGVTSYTRFSRHRLFCVRQFSRDIKILKLLKWSREMENISRGPTNGEFVNILTEGSMQDVTVARLYRVQQYTLPYPPSFKCSSAWESLCIYIPCATLKRRGSWVSSTYLWITGFSASANFLGGKIKIKKKTKSMATGIVDPKSGGSVIIWPSGSHDP